MLAAFLSHFKYFFLFQRYFTICLCSRADEKGMMQTLKFEVFPSLILFLDHRDPFFAACLFVPFFHLYRLQSLEKSASVPDPRLPPNLLHPKRCSLSAAAEGLGWPGGRAGPVPGFVKRISAGKRRGTRQSTQGTSRLIYAAGGVRMGRALARAQT